MSKELKLKTLLILDKVTQYFVGTIDPTKQRVVSSNHELQQLLATPFSFENIIVFVELDWGKPISNFQGYEVAEALMLVANPQLRFNLLFVSTFSREMLYIICKHNRSQYKNRLFTKKFEHIQLFTNVKLEKLPVPKYSNKKFDYLKNYCLREAGILDRLLHDVRNIKNNIDGKKLNELLADISANPTIFKDEVICIVERLKQTSEDLERKILLDNIVTLMEALQNETDVSDMKARKQSTAKVLLIEDDDAMREKLTGQLKRYFKNITSYGVGSVAYAVLEKNGKDFDVVITDMELLNGHFDDVIQGVDILELCRTQYPHIVTRVVTALPRNALTKILNFDIGKIIFKNSSSDKLIPPLENLLDFAEKIDFEVNKNNELRCLQGPRLSWWGKYLTQQLYITKRDDKAEYEQIWIKVKHKVDAFVSGNFDDVNESEKVCISFPKNQTIIKKPDSGWLFIEQLLSHRLIALWFSNQKSQGEFRYSIDSNSDLYEGSYVNQPGFQTGLSSKEYKTYFNTILGLSVAKLVVDHQPENIKYKIIQKDLFPEEREWLTNITLEILYHAHPNFHAMLMEFDEILVRLNNSESIHVYDALTCAEADVYLNDFILNPPADIAILQKLKNVFNMDKDKLDEYDEDAWYGEITDTIFEAPIKIIDTILNSIL